MHDEGDNASTTILYIVYWLSIRLDLEEVWNDFCDYFFLVKSDH